MEFALWSLIVGALLVVMALTGTFMERLPLSTAMLYLLVGVAVSPIGIGLLRAEPFQHKVLLERLTEIVVLVSLFTAGLKMSPGLQDRRWRLPVRLAVISMTLTVALIAGLAWMLLDLPLGACVLLGAILAPTDPVLASDVQMSTPSDRDSLRFALTGEGGLNDGTAFPFVMLGLGLLGLHELGALGWRWIAVDVLWATTAGLGIGAALGSAVGMLVLYLRRQHKEAIGRDDFLCFGLIALAYGAALLLHAYGFLAVFAAGVALRKLEQMQHGGELTAKKVEQALAASSTDAAATLAAHPQHAPAFMAGAMLNFNEHIERLGEVAVVITVGALLWAVDWQPAAWLFVPLLLLVIRPVSILLGLAGSRAQPRQTRLICWFGIRGVGSLYYLMYALNHGVPQEVGGVLVAITLSTVVTSIFVHGISVTPLMARYERKRAARKPS